MSCIEHKVEKIYKCINSRGINSPYIFILIDSPAIKNIDEVNTTIKQMFHHPKNSGCPISGRDFSPENGDDSCVIAA